jgi:hypothetical protein
MEQINRITLEAENIGLWITPAMQEFVNGIKKDNLTFKVGKNNVNNCNNINIIENNNNHCSCNCPENNVVSQFFPVDQNLLMLKISFITDDGWHDKMSKLFDLLRLTEFEGKRYGIYSSQKQTEIRLVKRGIFPKPAYSKFKEALLMIHPDYVDIHCIFYPSTVIMGAIDWNKINEFVEDKIVDNNAEKTLSIYECYSNVSTGKSNVTLSISAVDIMRNSQLLTAILHSI